MPSIKLIRTGTETANGTLNFNSTKKGGTELFLPFFYIHLQKAITTSLDSVPF